MRTWTNHRRRPLSSRSMVNSAICASLPRRAGASRTLSALVCAAHAHKKLNPGSLRQVPLNRSRIITRLSVVTTEGCNVDGDLACNIRLLH